MAFAVPYRKGEVEVVEKILAAVGGLFIAVGSALGLGKIGLALIGRGESKDARAFKGLQDELAAVRQRVTTLEEHAARREQEHGSEVGELRRQLNEANGERERLTLLTVQQAGRIQELEAKVAERSLPSPEVIAVAREVAQRRLGDGDA